MVRDVSFGQYFPGKSIIHRLDPRAKIIMFTAYLVIIFCTFNYISLAITTLFTVFYIGASGISPKFYFKSLKVIIFIVIITCERKK